MTILIIDDYELIAEGIIKRTQKVFPNANCIFANNIRTAYALLYQKKVDLIICDLEFDNDTENNGFDFIKKILSIEPRTKAIALTHYNSYRIMKKVKSAGFKSYLNKGCSFSDFSDTLKGVLKNGSYISQSEKVLLQKREKISKSIFNDSLKGVCELSKRELEIAILATKTTDRNKVANLMNIEPYTVDSHFKNTLSKLSLSNRKELAVFSMDFNVVLKKELNKKQNLLL